MGQMEGVGHMWEQYTMQAKSSASLASFISRQLYFRTNMIFAFAPLFIISVIL